MSTPNRSASPAGTSKARTDANRRNAQLSTGPKTPAGKSKSAANSLKSGFYASTDKLNPLDSDLYKDKLEVFTALHPDGPVEEQLVHELATFAARLQRLEAIEYALLAGHIDSDPADARAVAQAWLQVAEELERLQRSEVHLRRAYNRTWDRLLRIQKERLKMPMQEVIKRSQLVLTQRAEKENNPSLIPAHHPGFTPDGKFDPPKPYHRYREERKQLRQQQRLLDNPDLAA